MKYITSLTSCPESTHLSPAPLHLQTSSLLAGPGHHNIAPRTKSDRTDIAIIVLLYARLPSFAGRYLCCVVGALDFTNHAIRYKIEMV